MSACGELVRLMNVGTVKNGKNIELPSTSLVKDTKYISMGILRYLSSVAYT